MPLSPNIISGENIDLSTLSHLHIYCGKKKNSMLHLKKKNVSRRNKSILNKKKKKKKKKSSFLGEGPSASSGILATTLYC